MSLKYSILILFIFLYPQDILFIHPQSTNRIIHNKYEWDVAYHAATEFENLWEQEPSHISTVITPLAYTKLSAYDIMSYINNRQSLYCIILSFYEYTNGVATVRLYYPYYEQEQYSSFSGSSLAFIPYQYGYRAHSTTTQKLVFMFQQELLSSNKLFTTLPYKCAPLKIGIGINIPTILIEIGLSSLDSLTPILTILVQKLKNILFEAF